MGQSCNVLGKRVDIMIVYAGAAIDAAAFLGEVVVDGLEWATPSVGADVIRSLFWPSSSQRTALMRARGA